MTTKKQKADLERWFESSLHLHREKETTMQAIYNEYSKAVLSLDEKAFKSHQEALLPVSSKAFTTALKEMLKTKS